MTAGPILSNELVVVVLVASVVVLAFLLLRCFREAQDLKSRYSGFIDVDAELAAANKKLEQANRELEQANRERHEIYSDTERRRIQLDEEYKRRQTQLDEEYRRASTKHNELLKELSLLEENLEDISFGLYKPHFSFQSSDEYKIALEKLRDQERELIRTGRAAVCPVRWTVGGSTKEGERLSKLNEKLLLRAFNGECDAAVANVTWNNVTKMEERKSFEALNQLGEVTKVSLSPDYLKLKHDELRLTHEYETKRYQEREEQRRIREQIREEEKAKQEFEKARQDAENEETRFQKALAVAREEAAKATGVQLEKLTKQINSFEAKLDEARKKKERAISRAQLTKSGFVYVISNIGSFGDRVYKIGLTRRLEPMDRVHELGDASVPFPFDVHAMMFCDNAPEVEAAVHQFIQGREVNLVNPRKEFYRDVDLREIEDFVKRRGLSAQFTKYPEAREFRESLAKRKHGLHLSSATTNNTVSSQV
jgi:hypothetical protein